MDGAVDVPIDVSPIVFGRVAGLTVVGPDGEETGFSVEEGAGGIEVFFAEDLAPYSEYTLLVIDDYDGEHPLSFTTGGSRYQRPSEEWAKNPVISGLTALDAATGCSLVLPALIGCASTVRCPPIWHSGACFWGTRENLHSAEYQC